jgi:twinkle protein
MDIRAYLTSKNWEWKEIQRPKGLVAVGNCFFCDDREKKFAISLQDGAWSCMHENKCGKKGSWADFQRLLGDNFQPLDNSNYIYRQPIKYDKPQVKSENNNGAIKWLQGRGIWEATSAVYRIGQKGNEIMFPYFKEGELVNVKYRSMTEKKFRQEKNAEPVLFGRDFCKDKDYLIINEGEIDTLSFSQYGLNAVSVPSGASDLRWIETEWEFLNSFQKIYLAMDGDEAGQRNIDEIVKRLGEWRCYNVILPFKDANECLMNDVPDVKIQECIDNAKNYDPPTLKRATDFMDEVIDLFENPEKLYGISTPWDKLTEAVKGWREGELTVWSGRSGSGKSTMLNEVIYNLIKKKYIVIIASLEMMPKKYLKWMLARIKQKKYLDKEEIKEAFEEIKNLFVVNLNGEIKAIDLFEVLNFAARKYGVKHFFIDSLMKIEMKGNDKNEDQKNFCNYLIDQIAKKYQGHVHLVAHPRKSFKDTDRPDKMDIAGSGDITNLADNVFALYRLSPEEKKKMDEDGFDSADTVLSVLKNREWGFEPRIEFHFNPDTKTFIEI